MFLGCYKFLGDAAELLVACDRLMKRFGPEPSDLHVCVMHGSGITVLDACPSREVFEALSGSAEFRGAVHLVRCRTAP